MARPVEFVRSDVVDAAMHLFWSRGYESASVQQLLDVMHINRGSMYAAFGDKRSLFLEAIERYVAEGTGFARECLIESHDPLQGLRRLLVSSLIEPEEEKLRKGCLLINTVIEQSHIDPELAQVAQKHLHQFQCALQFCLQRAQKMEQIPASVDTEQKAQFIRMSYMGMRVMQREGAQREVIESLLDSMLDSLRFGTG